MHSKRAFLFKQYLIMYINHPLSAGMNDSEDQTQVQAWVWLQVLSELWITCPVMEPFGDLSDLTTCDFFT